MKRTARILSSFAVLSILIFGASAKGFASDRRDFNFDKDDTNFSARNFKSDGIRFRDRQLRSADKSVRLGDWKGDIFERAFRSRFEFRSEVRNAGRSFYKTNFRIRDNRLQNNTYDQRGFYLSSSSVDWPGKEIRNRSRAYREFTFRSDRRDRFVSDLNFNTDLEYRSNSFIA